MMIPSYIPAANCYFGVCLGLHEEVDYGEKLQFSDDEDDHSGDKKRQW